MEGSVIGRIDNVTILADNPNDLPVTVHLQVPKKKFGLTEPITLSVVIKNRSDKSVPISLCSASTYLCQNYESKSALEPEDHYYQEHPYNKPQLTRLHQLEPGGLIDFSINSEWMPEPGIYQVVYSLTSTNGFPIQSEISSINIQMPANNTDYIKALRFWLLRARPPQRVSIAERLLVEGDTNGITEVLRLLKAGEYSKEHYSFAPAYRFAWQHGGVDGEAAMVGLMDKQTKQSVVLTMLEGIYLSANRVRLLEGLLADNHPVYPRHLRLV